jgi:cytochrome P450
VKPLPAIEPMPPQRAGIVPWLGAGASLLRDPTAFFAALRARHGDTFVVDAFGFRLFCVFSPAGVRWLYALPERDASFGLATYNLVFRHKAPPELIQGRRHRPHDLFGAQEVEGYVAELERAVALSLEELGPSGRFEAFAFARRLGHRLSLGCWAGPEAASGATLDRLIPLLDALDTAQSFVNPAGLVATRASGRWRERRALRELDAILGAIVRERLQAERAASRQGSEVHRDAPRDFLDQIIAGWSDASGIERERGVARDVVVIHLGAQSNLYAALAWTLVNLLLHPPILARVRAGDDDLLERATSESIRLAQRSLTLRQVLRPLDFDDGARTHRLTPGVLIATMLSVTNASAAAGLDRFDPDHYEDRRLARSIELPARELVSTFGHGSHSCPAQRFSITAIRIALRRLLDRHELTPEFTSATPRRRQLGAVARAERACVVSYREHVSVGR